MSRLPVEQQLCNYDVDKHVATKVFVHVFMYVSCGVLQIRHVMN